MTYNTDHDADGPYAQMQPLRDRVVRVMRERLGVSTSIEFLEELAGGYTEAQVAKCDVMGAEGSGLDGQYIVKVSPVDSSGRRQSTAHEYFSTGLTAFAESRVPKLVMSAEDDQCCIDLYEIASGGLRGVHAAEMADSRQFLVACERVSGEMLTAQLLASTGRSVMAVSETLQKWLGQDFLEGKRGQALREARDLAGIGGSTFRFSDELLPDPLSVLAEENELTARTDIILEGICHGDLHLRNVLLDRTREYQGSYWLIDVNWSRPAPLLYDQAYLETAALLTLQARLHRQVSAQVLLECDELATKGTLELEEALFVDVVQRIRRGAVAALREHQPNRKDSLEHQYLLARLGAALNYAAKAMPTPERVTAFHVAAWVTKRLLSNYHETLWHRLLDQRVAPATPLADAAAPSALRSGAVGGTASAKPDQELSQQIKLFTGGTHNGFDRFLIVESGVVHPTMAHLAIQRWSAVIDLNPESETNGLAGLLQTDRADQQIVMFGLNDIAAAPRPGVVPWMMANGWQSRGEPAPQAFLDWRRSHLPVIRRLLSRQSERSPNRAAGVFCLIAGNEPEERTSRILEFIEESYEQVNPLLVSAGTPEFEGLLEAFEDARLTPRAVPPATLPGEDGPVPFEREMLTRLDADLEVLHSQTLSTQLRDEPIDEFWRGRPATWLDLDAGLDVPRDIQRGLEKEITTVLGKQGSATFELFHSPGAGGTTLARRIAWNLHRDYPVVLLLRYSQETVERIDEIYRRTRRSVAVVAETADLTQSERDNLYHRLHKWNTPTVVLWVTRTNQSKNRHHKYHLAEPISVEEASEFRQNFALRARDDRALAAVESLRHGEVPDQQLSPFYFGLAAFEEDFSGTRRYVDSHLQHLDERRLRVAKYLALVTRYSQNGLPYPLVRRWLTGKWGDIAASYVDYQDDLRNVLGEDLRHLVVDDRGELRLLHPFVAENVLEALLEPSGERRWQSRLADTAVEFIGQVCGHLGPDNAQTRRILQDLFIRRNKWPSGQSSSGARFAELIQQVPVQDEAYRIFRELTQRCPSEPHFWNHLGRYHIHEMRFGHDIAEKYLLKAIDLSEKKDAIHFHSLGMVLRLWVKQDLGEITANTGRLQEAVDRIQAKYERALDAFARGRKLDPEDEHSYVTPVQMIADVLNQLVRISPYENLLDLVRKGEGVGKWADGQLLLAESLLDELDAALPGHRRSSYHNTCERQLQALYGNIDSLVREWRSLVTESQSHSGAALVLARAFFREQKQQWSDMAPEAFGSVVELYESVFTAHGDLSDSDLRTWFRCYRKLETYDELHALERFAVLASTRSSLECNYYLYVLRFMRWLRGDEQTQREAERYLAEAKRLIRDSRRQYSYEWVGAGAPGEGEHPSAPQLVHFTELGDWSPEPELWKNSHKLLRVVGVIKEIDGPQSGWITVGDGRMTAFFVPKERFLRHRDINKLVEFYLGFSYEGLRAWSVEFSHSPVVSRQPLSALTATTATAPSTPRPVSLPPPTASISPPKPGEARKPAPHGPSAQDTSPELRTKARALARTNEGEAYRFVVRSMLARSSESAVTSLAVGNMLQETFGRQSYTRVLAGGKLRALMLRLGFHIEPRPNGQFAVTESELPTP
ncbi:hypothetical protein [Streptomyces sp. NPDC000405]|uniref:P-loop NTPase n=1 Tax=Streptomyces sp. NPDC000405 TaxID=3161033 RepID=UPI00398D46F1